MTAEPAFLVRALGVKRIFLVLFLVAAVCANSSMLVGNNHPAITAAQRKEILRLRTLDEVVGMPIFSPRLKSN